MSDRDDLADGIMDDLSTIFRDTGKRFPILLQSNDDHGPRSIPWRLIEPHREQVYKNHNQTLEELAQRGGLSWCELVAVLTDSRYDDLFPASTVAPKRS